ncbi:MAG: DUF3307 domain-containing protein [Stackebrandtia sp.]
MPATFAAVFAALYAAHHVADHWVQTDHQAATKGRPGWSGRFACACHVATYTGAAVVALAGLVLMVGVDLNVGAVGAGLAVSAVTHYLADRRAPLRWLADRTGSGRFYRVSTAGMNGAYLLDQSWHIGWLYAAALIIAT